MIAGTYNYKVTDANGCSNSGTIKITEPAVLAMSFTNVNVDCKGNSTGSITVSVSGGTTPYSYNIGGGSYGSSNVFNTLAAGTYALGIKDNNGCTVSSSQTITEPQSLSVAVTSSVT